jgi:hypothetical protein
MEVNKTVFVNEKAYGIIVEKLGYKPDNLVINHYIEEDGKAIVTDNDLIDTLKSKELSKSDW